MSSTDGRARLRAAIAVRNHQFRDKKEEATHPVLFAHRFRSDNVTFDLGEGTGGLPRHCAPHPSRFGRLPLVRPRLQHELVHAFRTTLRAGRAGCRPSDLAQNLHRVVRGMYAE